MLELYKPIGMTPNDLLDTIKSKYPKQKLACVGKLDPMAHGVMHVLIGEECKKINELCRCSKVYEFDLIVGLSTNTHDMLGVVTDFCESKPIDNIIASFDNYEYVQDYPEYSRVRVKGKPLWWWAKKNQLHLVKIPKKKIKIIKLETISEQYQSRKKIIETAQENISKIDLKHDFNQLIINKKFDQMKNWTDTSLLVYTLRAHVSGGTYIRKLVADISNKASIPCVANNIKRVSYNYD